MHSLYFEHVNEIYKIIRLVLLWFVLCEKLHIYKYKRINLKNSTFCIPTYNLYKLYDSILYSHHVHIYIVY